MKSINFYFLLVFACLFVSCSDDDKDLQQLSDEEGPEIIARWIDHPALDNDPTGSISDGGNYTISIESGFQFALTVKDASNITNGVVYFLVNNDPDLRENILYEGTTLGYDNGTISFIHRVNSISLGNGIFYTLQPGDTYHFYATFTDEHENMSSISWTADLTEP